MTATQSVTLERTLDAPIDLVWQMWTDPEHFAAWYGPAGATVPVIEMDVTVGGTRHFCIEMQTPDGQSRMWFVGEYRVIDQPNRLVYTESMSDPDGNRVSPEAMGMPNTSGAEHYRAPDMGRDAAPVRWDGPGCRSALSGVCFWHLGDTGGAVQGARRAGTSKTSFRS